MCKACEARQAKADATIRDAILADKFKRAQDYLRRDPPDGYERALAKNGRTMHKPAAFDMNNDPMASYRPGLEKRQAAKKGARR